MANIFDKLHRLEVTHSLVTSCGFNLPVLIPHKVREINIDTLFYVHVPLVLMLNSSIHVHKSM